MIPFIYTDNYMHVSTISLFNILKLLDFFWNYFVKRIVLAYVVCHTLAFDLSRSDLVSTASV